ncbi:MAG: chromosome segregation protein SMC [Synechococcales cyanobacterium T60_A2020_003]|nr:chromosome segregation protein SMC [Synechococcales cyanobacterium T60_A2020_003]
MYIKQVELSHFKSFGGTTAVPLLPGFTVISGPNGSGKSNILDALLFALGLSSSKGMRAERLPDLVNQSHSRSRSTVEASVTVTFDVEDNLFQDDDDDLLAIAPNGSGHNGNGHSENGHNGNGNGNSENGHAIIRDINEAELNAAVEALATEWKVTRKLRVTPQGTYTSNYFVNDQPCTLTELHEQLQKFHVYPEGYNVVLQGDVTSIISMNARERREIIDELAGVAAFDRKITQAKDKLDAVKDREERFRIVERELIEQRDRLAQDRIKAEKYQQLRAEFQDKSQWKAVLVWRSHQRQVQDLQTAIAEGDRQQVELTERRTALSDEIQQAAIVLDELNQRVKALGEEEQLAVQATLATREAELRQLQRQEQDLATAGEETAANLGKTQREIQEHLHALEQIATEQQHLDANQLASLRRARDEAQHALDQSREAANAIASASEAWVQEQTALRHHIDELQATLDPQRTEQAALQERVHQLQTKLSDQQTNLEAIATEQATQTKAFQSVEQAHQAAIAQVQSLHSELAEEEREYQIQQDTHARLLREQQEKQRQLDRLEAQTQAVKEAQGTGASQVILQAGLSGVCGLVAQLGRVDPQYQLALEIAAGARLGHLVVEDDLVAAAGIELLKRQRAGRATFLPLNKIRVPKLSFLSLWERPKGFIEYACNLIDCDDRYRDVFVYVFGNTVVFSTLADARPHMGDYRIVTLEGELLESSGAMTGGSISRSQSSLRFGVVDPGESTEAIALRDRLQEIESLLARVQVKMRQLGDSVKAKTHALTDARQQHRELQLQLDQLQRQLAALTVQEGQLRQQITRHTEELTQAQNRLRTLTTSIPHQEAELQQQRQALDALEESQAHSEWQQAQAKIRALETALNECQLAVRAAEQRLQDLDTQKQRLQDKIEQLQLRVQEYRAQQTTQLNRRTAIATQTTAINQDIEQLRVTLASLEQNLAAEKQERDRAERRLRDRQALQQELDWNLQKLQETQQEKRQTLVALREQLETQQQELPDPLPDIPADLGLEQLQQQLRSLQKRIQAMEPVNMLALEEYDRTQARLEELSQKLETLEEERTELLLRIENFTTLRQRAFREAFDAVNINFQAIFAELSDGDGYLQLEDEDDPFAGGLNLVAHPKGKPVQRLASMSGGEKSLTALSFIFALQRYRPSPFYAFDEVDMFLDGANVERLSRMIKHQSQQAQFIVVSLRRPMIESAERTIGVTQARGAYTQVLGLNLQSQ